MISGSPGLHFDKVRDEHGTNRERERGFIPPIADVGRIHILEAGNARGTLHAGSAMAEAVGAAMRDEDERRNAGASVPRRRLHENIPQDKARGRDAPHMDRPSEIHNTLTRDHPPTPPFQLNREETAATNKA